MDEYTHWHHNTYTFSNMEPGSDGSLGDAVLPGENVTGGHPPVSIHKLLSMNEKDLPLHA